MQRVIAGVFVVVGVACAPSNHLVPPRADPDLVRQPIVGMHPSPFAQITAANVHAVIPKQWSAVASPAIAQPESAFQRQGLVASPDLEGWGRLDGSVPGLEAVWMSVTHDRVPSDYYYLAATGPAIPPMATLERCRSLTTQVIVNHRPTFAGEIRSPGDYAARAFGNCGSGQRTTRWAYFVAAPGYGPVRRVGIPSSGLYVVVAVVDDGPDAAKELRRMLLTARFGTTSVSGLMQAARRSAQLR
jgi:hypothetical protein